MFRVFVFLLLIISKGSLLTGYDDGVSIYYYNGIPGCGCFIHCTCFSHCISDMTSTNWHPKRMEDRVWHEFMLKLLQAKKFGPYLSSGECSIRNLVTASNRCGFVCLLSEYLNVADTLGRKIEQARVDYINWYKELYQKPKEKKELEKHINRINEQASKAFQILSSIPATITPLCKELIENCCHKENSNVVSKYNMGLIYFLEGKVDESLESIASFIDFFQKNGDETFLTSEVYQKEGEGFLEVGLYHQAIESLNNAISKDPKNLEVYFQRASAYFEIGDFEKSLEDYLHSEKNQHFTPNNLASGQFIEAFSQAVVDGAYDAACDFVPSLCNTVYGLGESLWAFGEHPVDSVHHLAGAGYEMVEHVVDYLKSVDKEKLHQYAAELVNLYEDFDQLNDHEKGKLIGYTIGKYGVDIFAGSATIKGISAYKKLKEANRICNFQSMAISTASKEAVISRGLQQYCERRNFFEKSKIHWGRQNKHIPGTNSYVVEGHKSILLHRDPSHLLNKHAGTGRSKRGVPGKPGYKETVDFKECIGIWKTEDGALQLPTTRGTIHYSKTGAHIVPAKPKVMKE